jgi:hypothetical protein
MAADPNAVSDFAQRLKAKHNIPGRAYFVNAGTAAWQGSAGSNNASNGISELQPFATIDFAIGQCTANRGDAIFVMGPHSETITATITMDVAGVQIIGVPIGNRKPRITLNGATDAVSMEAADCRLSNLFFTIVTTDAATAIVDVSAARCRIDHLDIIPSATSVNVVDVFTIASGADDLVIEDCDIRNTTVAVNSFVNIEAAVARLTIRNNFMFGDVVASGVIDAAAATLMLMENNTVGTIGTTKAAITLDSNPTGVHDNNRALGTHTTIATNFDGGNAARQARSMVLEATDNSVQATNIIPALDTE